MWGVSRTFFVNVDSPNLGFPYLNLLKKITLYLRHPVVGFFLINYFQHLLQMSCKKIFIRYVAHLHQPVPKRFFCRSLCYEILMKILKSKSEKFQNLWSNMRMSAVINSWTFYKLEYRGRNTEIYWNIFGLCRN